MAAMNHVAILGAIQAGEFRASIAVRDLKLWINKVDLPFHSPHKFRHGHAVYALKMAKDIAALKAVSQNLMHSNISITDGVYGILSDHDIRKQIIGLSNESNLVGNKNIEEMIILAKQIINKFESNNQRDNN